MRSGRAQPVPQLTAVLDHEEEGQKLLKADEKALNSVEKHIGELPKNCFQGKRLTAYGGRAPGPVNPDSLYEGIQYKCSYLGSTQLISTSRYFITLTIRCMPNGRCQWLF